MQEQNDAYNGHQWRPLGFAYFQTPNAAAVATSLSIRTTPSCFRDFILSCTHPTRTQIFSNNPKIPATLLPFLPHNNADDSILLHHVSLSFEYCYTIDIPIIGGKHYVTPRNALACYLDHHHLGFGLQDKTPDFALLTMASFLGGAQYQHGLDLQVWYHWFQNPNNTNEMVLSLQIYQDPIPKIPTSAMGVDVAWKLLGAPTRIDWVVESYNELLLGINVLEFVQSVPEEGQLRDEFYRGKGIRASNVYTATGLVQGSQVRVAFDKQGCFLVVIISIGTLLETNPNFRGKMIEVYYRWRGVALELTLVLAAGQD